MNDVIAPLNETTPNLGLNKPTVGGDDDIWGFLLNDNADVLDTSITGLRGEIAALTGILLFIGSYDAVADHAYFTGASGFPDGPLPPASVSNFNVYLIVTVGGTASGNAPPGQLVQGDWLVSDGIRWNRLALGIPPGGDIAAANVTVTPAVQGAADVQTALEQLENNYLPLSGGQLGGTLITLAGSSVAPALQFVGADAGFWKLGNELALNANGAPKMSWGNAGITAYAPMTLNADPTAALGAATKQYVDATPALHNIGRNLIHNPLFNVAQRGAGPWTTSVYTADRWLLVTALDTVNAQVSGFTDAQRAQVGDEAAGQYWINTFTGNAGAGACNYVDQSIEGVRRLAGKTVTVSFWAIAGKVGTKVGINLSQNFGTGGSPSTSIWVLGTGMSVTLGLSFTRYSVTIPVPGIAGKTLGTNNNDKTELILWFSSGATSNAFAGNIGVQNDTVALWGVQLEIGSVATPLEKPDPRYDLANCQRFYQTGLVYVEGYNAAGGAIGYQVSLPTLMRAAPTVVLGNQSYVNASGAAAANQTYGGFNFRPVITATGSGYAYANFSVSADL